MPKCSKPPGKELPGVNEVAADGDSRNPNPMLNPVVLTRLFTLCSLSSLPQFRLVSKLWHSLTLTRFRNEMTVIIQPGRDALSAEERELDFEGGLRWHTMDRQLDVGGKPFKTFRLCYMEFDNLSKRQNAANEISNNYLRLMYRNMRLFFTYYGTSIRKLELWKPQVSIFEELNTAVFQDMPNLEELILVDLQTTPNAILDDEGGMQAHPNLKMERLVFKGLFTGRVFSQLIAKIPTQFPNIQKVEVVLDHRKSMDNILEQLTLIPDQLIKARTNVKLIISPPMRLRLNTVYPEGIQKATRVLEFPLLTLLKISIHIYVEPRKGDMLRNLVETLFRRHGHTLKELELIVHGDETPHDDFPFCPGPFNSLTGMALGGGYWGNLYFLEQFPNLETLKILNCSKKILETTSSPGMRRVRLNNLREFSFSSSCNSYTIPAKSMKMLVKIMPNVEQFEFGKS